MPQSRGWASDLAWRGAPGALCWRKRPAWAGGSVARKVMATAREGRRGGREARRQERTSMQVAALPVLDRKIPVYEILDEESLERIHQARSTSSSRSASSSATPRRCRCGARRAPRSTATGCASRPAADGAGRQEPEPLHRARPQSRAQHRDRRQQGRVRTDLRLAIRLRLDNERRYGTLADLQKFHQLAYLAPAIHNTGRSPASRSTSRFPSATCTSPTARSSTPTSRSWGR